ncbi:right-handed parallel beta-helix repeat-containing protein [Hymenobacter sp. 15J16-1T3B]|uniref:beta strand repeat-containing protein n=1 Tax=Hymenobacter sp. 15J16-1T3B TaxID=2886941 RepID=UPI001D0FB8F6|nr:T9SS type A sorting domain-containing protein [Hymenobacter sp. 15J16-1T3B]MCC3156407.1 right-handed parallel beta-helix repeat-containing protein [Hymenobacter sp. 15J16-1T3B]
MQARLSSCAPARRWAATTRSGRRAAGALLLLLASSAGAWAQTPLSGTYTINNAQATAGTNFASFADAATALNTNGVSGPVTINVSGGPYTEQVLLNAFTGSSATNRVTINGNGRKIQFGSSATAQRAVVTLNGADYVTINNLLVDATVGGTSTSTYGWGIQVMNGSDNDVISNCTVSSSTSSTSSTNFVGIVANNSTSSLTTGGNAGSNLTIENNTITGGYYGIRISGASTAVLPGYQIKNNTLQDFYLYGVDADYTTGAQIIGNDVSRPTRTVLAAFYGISLGAGNLLADIEKNRIHNPAGGNPASTSTVFGLYLSGCDAPAGSENELVNNLVYDFNGAGIEYGIYNSSSDNVRYYHNSISLDNAASTSADESYGFYQTTAATGIELRNNILSVRRGGAGERYAITLNTATSTVSSDYNDLVVGTGANSYIGRIGTATAGTKYATLADWKAANSNAYDQNSVAVVPQFTNAATGNLLPSASGINNVATPLARVTDDVTGAARSSTPDIGAYEFTPGADDVAVVGLTAPLTPAALGANTVTVSVRNNGLSPLTSVRLQYTVNGGTAVVQNFTGLNLAAGASQALSFTQQATLGAGATALVVTASLPNGNADTNPANNTLTQTVYTGMVGTFTINKNAATGGTNFASFADAAAALNLAGISGSVRINVLNGPYTEQFVLGEVAGVSAADTILIDGGANKQTLSYVGTSAQPGAVVLNGTDYVTLRNLTIDASAGTTYGIGVLLVGQANRNRVADCVVMGPATATSTTGNAAIVASGGVTSSTSAGDANHLRLERNVISGGYYCVVLTGNATTNNVGLRVTGNEIRDFYMYGLDVENQDGARLIGNNIHRSTRATVSTFYGIYQTGNTGTAVERNRIHTPFGGITTTSTSSAYGIYSGTNDAPAGAENDVVNNLVYNFTGGGVEYGIYNSGSDNARYYHNIVSLNNTAATSTSASYGFYQITAATGIEFLNNIVSVTRGGTGSRYALYFSTTGSAIASNYNDLHIGSGSNFYTGRYSTNFATLADWKAANGNAYDQNSLQVDPLFPSATDLVPAATQVVAAGTAATLPRVPADFLGVTRTSPPDLGAYTLRTVVNDVDVVSIDAPTTPAALGLNAVTVTIRNGGTATLSSVTLAYSLDGGTPVTQNFTGLSLATGASQQLTFTTGITLTQLGTFTLTVTGSLPNGQPDANALNNTQTTTFDQLTPPNDGPCTATSLAGGSVNSSNANATFAVLNGVQLPACSPAQSPKDVWFTFTATGSSTVLYITGDPAGMVRVFSTANCAGPFTQVFCQSSGVANTSVGTVTVTGLTANQLYYVAVSGYGSSDTQGAFTIGLTPLSTRAQTNAAALAVYPNPSATGQLAVKLAGYAGAGSIELVNALGQAVRRQSLQGSGEQHVSTQGLAAGLYTLRLQVGSEVLTRKVVLQ